MLCCSINKILVQQVFFRCFFTLHSLICGMESREWNESENPDDYVTVQPLDRFCLFFAHYVFMHPSPTVFLAFLGRSQPAVQQLKNSSKRSHLAVTHFSHCCNFHLCPKLVFCFSEQLWNQKSPPLIYLACFNFQKTCWSTKFSKSLVILKSIDDSCGFMTHPQPGAGQWSPNETSAWFTYFWSPL